MRTAPGADHAPMTARIASSTSSGGHGFARNVLAPAAAAADRMSALVEADTTMTGTSAVLGFERRRRRTDNPSSFGNAMSRTMTSQLWARAHSRAAFPSAALETS